MDEKRQKTHLQNHSSVRLTIDIQKNSTTQYTIIRIGNLKNEYPFESISFVNKFIALQLAIVHERPWVYKNIGLDKLFGTAVAGRCQS